MIKHPHFDLDLHTTEELSALLGEPVTERAHLHSWPLSSVERLTTASGQRWVYKSQHAPTFEPEVYAAVRSPLLPGHRLLTRDAERATMLLEFIDAPVLRDLALPADELARHGRALVEAVGTIEADVPVYVDIASRARWAAFVDRVLAMLAALTADGRLTLSVDGDVSDVAAWAASPEVLALIDTTSRLTHGDGNPGNAFLTADGYRIIDWQQPKLAPRDTDLVCLLEGYPTLFEHAPAPAIGVFYMLRLHWAVEAKTHLLPQITGVFDRWSSDALSFIRQAAASV